METNTGTDASTECNNVGLAGVTITPAHWAVANKRRGELIDKEYKSELTDEEEAELEKLQELADRYIAQEGIYKSPMADRLFEQLAMRGLMDRKDEAASMQRYRMVDRILNVLFTTEGGICPPLEGGGKRWTWGSAREEIYLAIFDFEVGNPPKPREPANQGLGENLSI